jgi:putative hydrolase of the HAD superfamily
MRVVSFDASYTLLQPSGLMGWELCSDVLPTLNQLEGYELVVFSNFDASLREMLRDLGIGDRFREVFCSTELGAAKPQPEAFRRVEAGLSCASSDIVHVGDSPDKDYLAAKQAGWGARLLLREGPELPEAREAGEQLRSLQELPASLK